jgi:hypothetical protein
LSDKLRALVVVEKAVVDLERILRGDDKPYFVQSDSLEKLPRQGDMPVVDGVEGAAVDADHRFYGLRSKV